MNAAAADANYRENSMSYSDTVVNNPQTSLSMLGNMGHSHVAGWTPKISYIFADWITKTGAGLASYTAQPSSREIHSAVDILEGISDVSAKLFYITESASSSKHEKQE